MFVGSFLTCEIYIFRTISDLIVRAIVVTFNSVLYFAYLISWQGLSRKKFQLELMITEERAHLFIASLKQIK